MAFVVKRVGFPPHPAESWAHRWAVPATMALAYYSANCAGGDIVACWDRDCIRGPCQWVKDRGYFDGTAWHIPEFRQWGLDWPQVRDFAWANGLPTWLVERFVWDNARLPVNQDEAMQYMAQAGIKYVAEHAKIRAFIESRPDIVSWSQRCYDGTAWGCGAARGAIPWNTATEVAVFYAWWETMSPPERNQYNWSITDFICARYPDSWTCSIRYGGAPPLDCSAQGKSAWASQVGVPACVADLFCAQFGRLPQSVDELVSWGSSKGIRCSDGSWNCSGCVQPPPPPGGGDRCKGVQCPAGQACNPDTGQCQPVGGGGGTTCQEGQVQILGKCLSKNLLLLGGAAAAAYVLLRR